MPLTYQGEIALLSLSDRRGVEVLARACVEAGMRILATGGTERHLRSLGFPVEPVEALTGFPEVMGGRVKTLHPLIYAGILMREHVPEDRATLLELGGSPVRLVAVTLYPFEEETSRADDRIERIDIGGVTLLRAAAKNFHRVYVVSDPSQYEAVALRLADDTFDRAFAEELARAAFFRTARYEAAIANWFEERRLGHLVAADVLPEALGLVLRRELPLRYGENPHQPAAWYRVEGRTLSLRVLFPGRDGISANNLMDADAAQSCLRTLLEGMPQGKEAAVIVKHGMPSSAAVGETVGSALARALDGDREAAFGGIVALSAAPDSEAQALLDEWFFEVLVVPEGSLDEEAAKSLSKRPRLRVLAWRGVDGRNLRPVGGGVILEERDRPDVLPQVDPPLPEALADDLLLAWRVVAHARSNAVVLAHRGRTVGIGQGQVSRVRAVEEAIRLAGEEARGAVAASDAFFPFPDSVEKLAEAGVAAVVAPAGSRNDREVARRAEELGIRLIFAERRHFRHG